MFNSTSLTVNFNLAPVGISTASCLFFNKTLSTFTNRIELDPISYWYTIE